MPDRIQLDNVHIVLHKTKYPENIGSAARAMWNMGLSRLDLVAPENFNRDQALKLATHEAAHIVDQAKIHDRLEPALAGCHYVVGTTARLGKQRQVIQTPEILAAGLIPVSQKNRIAILFGPEDRGLSNENIRSCHALLNIPTAGFSSINLAQAVMIVSYALHTAGVEERAGFTPRMASRHELDGMYAQLRDILVRISYINPENPDYFMNNMRRFFTRLQLRAKDVTMIRGIIRQVDWYANKRYQDGLNESAAKKRG